MGLSGAAAAGTNPGPGRGQRWAASLPQGPLPLPPLHHAAWRDQGQVLVSPVDLPNPLALLVLGRVGPIGCPGGLREGS